MFEVKYIKYSDTLKESMHLYPQSIVAVQREAGRPWTQGTITEHSETDHNGQTGREMTRTVRHLILCTAVLGVNESKGCLGARCCIYMYIGAPQYTMLGFRFPSLCILR